MRISERGRVLMSSAKDRKNNKVSFRLPPAYMEDLVQRTAEREAPSVHLCAREIYMNAVANGDVRVVQADVQSLREDFSRELKSLRSDFIHLATNLFVHAGKLSLADAEGWVQANFGGRQK